MYGITNINRYISLLFLVSILLFSFTCIYDKERDNSNDYHNKRYTVTYNGNGNDSGSVPVDSIEYKQGQTVTVLGNTGNLAKTNYTFAGWNTQADGMGTTYTQGETFTIDAVDVILYARWTWTRLLGVAGAGTYGLSISVDSNGNSYVTGYTNGNLDGETLTGTYDVFVTKYNSSGIRQWTKLLGVAGASTYGNDISIDAIGNCYITGRTDGDLDGQALTGTDDVFVIKYDSSGVKQWTRLLGVSGSETYGYGISIDSSGNSYITGRTVGDLDGQTLTGIDDLFVIKYNTSGTKRWTRLSGTSGAITRGFDITVDSNGNSYVTGYTNGNLDGQILTGTYDVFVIKYDSLGVKQWTRLQGVAGASTYGWNISIDTIGNCYITGSTDGDLDGQTLTGLSDIFVIKYDSSGAKQWTRLLGGTDTYAYGNSISIDSSDNCYVTGCTEGDLDEQTLTGNQDAFVIKYDSSGARQWTRLLGGTGTLTYGEDISIDSGGNCYVAGYTNGNLDGEALTGTTDVFVTTRFN